VTSTKSRCRIRATLIEGIRVRFEGGRLWEAHAVPGEVVLQRMIETDEGPRRLG